MRLKAALSGNLTDYLNQEYQIGATAVTKGIRTATDGLKGALRSQVKSAGLGNRLANTWRGNIYPKSTVSIGAAGVVYTKAPKIMEGFEYQSIIRSKNGFWLAIPTPAIKKRAYGKRITPDLYEKSKGVKLRFVYRTLGPSLLVHEQRKKTIIAFILIPQVKMPKLIDFETVSGQWQDQVPQLILNNWKEEND